MEGLFLFLSISVNETIRGKQMGPKLVVFFHGIEAEGSNGGEETYEQIDEEDDGKSYVSLGGWIRRKRWAGKRFVALDNDP